MYPVSTLHTNDNTLSSFQQLRLILFPLLWIRSPGATQLGLTKLKPAPRLTSSPGAWKRRREAQVAALSLQAPITALGRAVAFR